jgi:hypothetical protein
MLIRTPEGVRVLKDWDRTKIGCAYQQPKPSPGEGMEKIQAVLLGRGLANMPGPGEAWDADVLHHTNRRAA